MSSSPSVFASVEDVLERFRACAYVTDRRVATAVYLADQLGKPLLVEGPAGVGKTELAKVISQTTGCELVRLQCYEGLDEAKALYEWEYPKQLLYTQILRDKVGEVTAGAGTLAEAVDRLVAQEDAFFSERFLLQRPLLRAIRSEKRVVLLVDEVDRAESEFEAFLLEVLSDFQVTVPELGTLRARHTPLVVLTSNSVRELTDALRRRCLHLHVDFPDAKRELEIVKARLPDVGPALATQLVTFVQSLRALDLKKKPSVAETLDWARALTVLNAAALDDGIVRDTLDVILKHQGDVERAEEKLGEMLAKARATPAASA